MITIRVQCDACGSGLDRPKTQVEKYKHNFCSNRCQKDWQAAKTLNIKTPDIDIHDKVIKASTKVCPYCNKEFYVQASLLDRYTHCSIECRTKDEESRKITKECSYCGSIISRSESFERSGVWFCSSSCFYRWRRDELGRSYNYKGQSKSYRGPNWMLQRKKALVRANYCCESCGASADNVLLDVAHLRGFDEFDLEDYKDANSLSNLKVMCRSCHLHYDWSQGSRRKNFVRSENIRKGG